MSSRSNWIRRDLKLAIHRRDDWCCAYCGCELEEDTATIDHIDSRKGGGSNDPYNLVTACRPCNSAKGSMSAKEFAPNRMPHIQKLRRRRLKRRRKQVQREIWEAETRAEIESQVRAEYRARYGEDDTDIPF